MARYPDMDGNWFSELNSHIWLDVTEVSEPDEEPRFWVKFGPVREDAVSLEDLVDLRDYLDKTIAERDSFRRS